MKSIRRCRSRKLMAESVEKVSVKAGRSVTLENDITIQVGDVIQWTFGVEKSLIVKYESGKSNICESYRGRVQLNKHNGSLTITNITNADFGHFQLQVINSKQNRFRRFNVIKDSTGNIEQEPLLHPKGVDEEDKPQATSLV